MNWKTELGEQIKAAREDAGLSQDELAAASEVSRQTIILWETGKRGPSIPTFARVAFALKRPFMVSGYYISIQRGRRRRIPQQFCLPFGKSRLYPGATLRIHPTKARLIVEASVRRVVFSR